MAKHPVSLQAWMDNESLNDREAAIRLGISRSQVNRLRRRECRPNIETAQILERVTAIPAAKLVMGEA